MIDYTGVGKAARVGNANHMHAPPSMRVQDVHMLNIAMLHLTFVGT